MRNEHLIKLKAALKQHVWGGTKIHDVMHKDIGNISNVAESWEISTHLEGLSGIDSGKFNGKTLKDYFDTIGWEKLGTYGRENKCLPIMVKYIDATCDLSIQVHPGEEYARLHENDSGKNEMWFIVSADKNAYIYLGFNKDVTREEVGRSLESGTIEQLLNKVPVKRGEVYYIPAGTVHAIGKGCFICEIQQTSNVTYRLYDYERLGLDGKLRELQVDKGLDVLNYDKYEIIKTHTRNIEKMSEYLNEMFAGKVKCSLFSYQAKGEFIYTSPHPKISFALTYKGKGQISCDNQSQKTMVGDTWLLNGKAVYISGNCRVLLIALGDK